jgi:hypothetical protein
MIYTPSYDAYFGRNFDRFGDSYTEPLQADQLRRSLDDMKVDVGDDRIQLAERAELMKAMFGDNEYALFRGFRYFYISNHQEYLYIFFKKFKCKSQSFRVRDIKMFF